MTISTPGAIQAQMVGPGPHIDEDALELYALERLSEADAAPIEEHLWLAGCAKTVLRK